MDLIEVPILLEQLSQITPVVPADQVTDNTSDVYARKLLIALSRLLAAENWINDSNDRRCVDGHRAVVSGRHTLQPTVNRDLILWQVLDVRERRNVNHWIDGLLGMAEPSVNHEPLISLWPVGNPWHECKERLQQAGD